MCRDGVKKIYIFNFFHGIWKNAATDTEKKFLIKSMLHTVFENIFCRFARRGFISEFL